MAKKKTIQDYLDELQNRGAFTDANGFDEDKAKEHINSRMAVIAEEIKKWNDLKFAIQSHYAELDRLSGKKYRLFNVPTWKEDLSKAEKEYKYFYKNLKETSDDYNAKWGKASKKTIEDNYDEWLKDNNRLVELQKQSLEMTQELAAKAMDEFRKGSNVFDRLTPHIKEMFKGMVQGVNETKDGMTKMWNAYSSWVEPWAKANQAAADFSKNVGLGAAGMQNLLSETIRFANQSQIGIKYNKSLEEMIKLQQEYTNAVGRNIGLTDNYKESLAAMSAVMGDQKTADIAGKLENFGINPEETGRRMGKMFSDASKKGIAFSKYSETFANNIKMAQNYTFANGVKGVASMAEKATKLKLEMQSVAQFAEKVNTVEGAITTGAKLQVLGGAFTQFADPLQMLYEGTSDAEGLQDRIINMFGDLGRFNKLTGEVEVSAFDRQRIRAAGEAIGVNSAELMDMIHAKGKRNEIANQMRGLGYSADLEELIMNTATFDDSGRAGVSINGQFVGVDQLAGREQELIALNQTETEDIKEIATTLRGWDDTMQGFKKQLDAKQASWVEKSGLGAMGMQAVQYLGQANWALNTIVGVLTAGKALNFGMGAYNTVAGVTRTGAAAFQRVRMNKWMKDNKLAGKDLKYSQRVVGKNIGVIISPDRSGNRSAGVGGTDFRAMRKDWFRSQGADLGINNGGIPLDPNRGYNNYLSMPGMPTSTGTPNVSAGGAVGTPSVAAGGMGYSPMYGGMGYPPMYGGMGYNPGTTTFGTPNVAPATGQASAQVQGTATQAATAQGAATAQAQGATTQVATVRAQGAATQATTAQAQGATTAQVVAQPTSLPPGAVASTSSNLSLYNTNKANTWHDGAGNKVVLDKKGNYRLYTEGKKGYTNLGKSLDAQKYQDAVRANQKAIQQSIPKYQFNGEAGQRLASNEVLKLKNGTTVRLGDFQYSKDNPNQLINPKTGQKITMNSKNGQWMLSQKGQRTPVSIGRAAEGGGFQTNNNTVASTSSNLSLYNTNKANTWHDGAGNKVVLDKKGNYRLYTEGKKGYTNLGKSLDAQKYQDAVRANQKAIQQSIPKYQFNGEAGQRLASNEVLKLKNGTTVRLGDFQYSKDNPNQLINPKTGQKITMNSKNGQWMLSQKGQRTPVSIGRAAEGGGFQTNNNTVASARTSRSAAFKQWGSNALKTGGRMVGGMAAMAGGMLLGAGLNAWGNSIETKRQEAIAKGEYEENSNEDWKQRKKSSALGWAGQGATMGASLGMMFGPWGALIGAAAGGLIGAISGWIKGSSEQKREQEKERLLTKIAKFRNGQRLSGEYDNVQLARIAKYVETNDSSHLQTADLDNLKKNGNDFNIIVKKKFAFGGWDSQSLEHLPTGFQKGKTHAEGGIIRGNSEVENREFIIKASAARQIEKNNPGALDYMNATGTLALPKLSIDSLMPKTVETVVSPKPLNPNIMKVNPTVNAPQITSVGPTEISLKPLDININGSIKLDAGKGNQVDIIKILQENPTFIRNLTEMIEKQININTNGAYNKEKSLNKF